MIQSRTSSDLITHFDRVLALPDPLAVRYEIQQERQKLLRGKLNAVVVGRFKRGKSTLLNALVGRPILPMGVVPVTALVTLLRPGEREAAHVEFVDGQSREIPLERLAEYVSEAGNPENRKGIERVVVELPDLAKLGSLVLADTPGSGSVFRHNTAALERWLGHIDAAVFVVSTDPPMGEGDCELLAEVAATAGDVLVALNKSDRLRPEELEASLLYTRDAVEQALGTTVQIVPCSARRSLEGEIPDPGVEKVANWVRALAAGRGQQVLARAVARRTARALGREATLVDVERAAARRSVSQLEEALEDLESVRREMGDRVHEVAAAFDSGCKNLLSEFDDAVRRWQEPLVEGIGSELRQASLKITESRVGMLRFTQDLEATRDAIVTKALEPFQKEREERVIKGFSQLTERALHRVNELVDGAFERAARRFGVEMRRFDVSEGFEMASRLEYRVGLPKVNLDYIIEGFFLFFPPPLGRRLVTRRHERQLAEALGRQLGLIRGDLQERVTESAFSFKGELGRRIEDALEQLRSAVERGRILTSLDRAQLAERLAALDDRSRLLQDALAACTRHAAPEVSSLEGSQP
ncbi:MAG: dynamin family protein [Acidobacteria bacterium]|nr:dynamin family protein [Acidobacteriota bacterium]